MNKAPEQGAEPPNDPHHRHKLWRIWDPDKPKVLFVMLNPSTANADKDDNTIRKCRRMVEGWDFGGFYVGNLFSNRTSKPHLLWTMDINNSAVLRKNDEAIAEMQAECALTVVAWGNNGSGQPERVRTMLAALKNPMALKLTKSGAPWHPAYMRQYPMKEELVAYRAP